MKKLKLNLSNLKGAELLTREQLKVVFGGDGSGSGAACVYASDCKPDSKELTCGSTTKTVFPACNNGTCVWPGCPQV